jgi:cell division protein FtsI/penicillin-binding protein 2
VATAIVSPTGKVVKKFSPQVTGHVNLPPVNQQAMLAGFEGAVNSRSGTAYGVPGLASFPGGLAGKTGTADTEIGKEPTAWFVGWGPTASAAQYLVVCVIDQAGYGASAAAPVVGQIFSYLAAHPVTPPAIPPGQSVYQSTVPLTPPSPTTTTTTAGSTTNSTTGTSTASPNG